MQVALLQYDIAWEDKSSNHERMEAMLSEAGLGPDTYILLPELSDTGFSMNLDTIAADGGRSVAWARDMAREHGWTIQIGHAERDPAGKGRNCATIFGAANMDGSAAEASAAAGKPRSDCERTATPASCTVARSASCFLRASATSSTMARLRASTISHCFSFSPFCQECRRIRQNFKLLLFWYW